VPQEPRGLVTEIDDEINAAALNTAGERAVGGGLPLGNRSLQAQEVGELVFELELADVARAEQLPELEEQALADLLADGDRRPLALVARWVELEDVDVERPPERVGERRRHEP